MNSACLGVTAINSRALSRVSSPRATRWRTAFASWSGSGFASYPTGTSLRPCASRLVGAAAWAARAHAIRHAVEVVPRLPERPRVDVGANLRQAVKPAGVVPHAAPLARVEDLAHEPLNLSR